MMDTNTIRSALNRAQNIVVDGEEVRVNTDCLYPTGEHIRVVINGAGDTFFVSDAGGWFKQVTGEGRYFSVPEKSAAAIARSKGVRLSQNCIVAGPTSLEGVAPYIALVAEASREMSEWGFSKSRFKKNRDFKEALLALMNRQFPNNMKKDVQVVGRSTKQYKFDYGVREAERLILVDSVLPDAASVNSRVVANLDVRQNQNSTIGQIVVYDDEDQSWGSSDLSLLGMAASLVPFSRAERAIHHMVVTPRGFL